jgi:hypothetical protein
MKTLKLTCLALVLLIFGCSKPAPVEIRDVCGQPEGTNVVTQGYLSLPNNMETMTTYRKGSSGSTSYQLFLMTRLDATGDSVRVILAGSAEGKPNKIKPLPPKYTWNDLFVYTDDGKAVGPGKLMKLSGTVKPNDKGKCDVNVYKIETP